MTREEYLQLIQNSSIFKSLDKINQDKISQAVGKKMDDYVAMFHAAGNDIVKAKKEFMKEAVTSVKDLNATSKKAASGLVIQIEIVSKNKDDRDAEILLKSM